MEMPDETKCQAGADLPRPVIDADECKSCGRCVAACPKKCLQLENRLNSRGVKPVAYAGSGCIGCAICFYNCPEPYAIKILRK
jgi:2-oxoisovalerate ferredoxin oxidoreductase delta subunit